MSWNKPEKGLLVGETSIEDRIEVSVNEDMTGFSGAESDSRKSIEALTLQPNNDRSTIKSAEVCKECRKDCRQKSVRKSITER